MKTRFVHVLLELIYILSYNVLIAQISARVQWDCITDQNPTTVVGKIEAQPLVGSKIEVRDYIGGNCIGPLSMNHQRWWSGKDSSGNGILWGLEKAPFSDRYIQLEVAPNAGNNFTVIKVELYMAAGGTNNMRANVAYSITSDFSNSTSIADTIKLKQGSTKPEDTLIVFNGNVEVNSGSKFLVRIFPWYIGALSSTKYVYLQKLSITGITTPIDVDTVTFWNADISVADKNNSKSQLLTYGINSTATDEIDSQLGEFVIPPMPPEGIFDARFLLPLNIESSLKDFRSNSLRKIEWQLNFQPGSSGYPVSFVWDNLKLPKGSFILSDMINGSIVNVNMKTQNSYILTYEAITKLKIVFTKDINSSIKLDADWNIFSVPVITESMKKSVIFPNATSPAYAYSNGYVSTEDLTTGKGYWIRYSSGTNITLTGQQVNATTIPLLNGWNMIGPFERNVKVSELTTTPANIISSPFYGYSAGYKIPDSLKIGKGYWIRVNADGVINLPSGLAKKSEMNALEVNIKEDWTKIEISDLNNRSNTLYLSANTENNVYDLPPSPPEGIFDVRWSSDRIVENVNGANELRLNSLEYPVKIKVIGSDLRIKDKVNGRFINQLMRDGESLQITNSAVERLEITRVEIPAQFELYQNYPNPFNPTTTIKYAVAEDVKVSLVVYDMLGRVVKNLVDGQQEAGFYTMKWDGTNEYGSRVASGIYIYRLQAGSFTSTIKMNLMK